MAYLYNTHGLFFVTSPRSPLKMIPEIDILIRNYKGKEWNQETQMSFAKDLSKATFFEGKTALDSAFSARDRINRAPKALGFVDLSPTIQLTEAGHAFLYGKRPHEIFTRQLLKFQLPSPYHIDRDTSRFFVKPYLELLRLIYELDGLSKDEIAIFVMQLTHINKYETVKNKIIAFREHRKRLNIKQTSYKRFVNDLFKQELMNIYKEAIVNKRLKTRESKKKTLKKFLETKMGNFKDYADAAYRYIRDTKLVTLDSKSYRLIISPDKVQEVEHILTTVPREPIWFENESEYKKYLFDASSPLLLSDNRDEIIKSIRNYDSNIQNLSSLDIESLKDIRDELVEKRKHDNISKQVLSLKAYKDYQDIISTFEDIIQKNVIDPPLIMEWNTWRTFTMLNDGNIIGNFKFDENGMPLSTAPGNLPDIVCEYDDFDVLVEVTLSSGQKQYEMEGEPVPRHLGNHKKKRNKDTYCIFVAKNLNEATLAHFFYLHKVSITYYGGTSKIIPMALTDLINMLACAKRAKIKPTAQTIKTFVEHLSKSALKLNDEKEWYKEITEYVQVWATYNYAS